MNDLPRLRFAPSPTGYFHVGGARTALFNWFVARKTGGVFVLRIEDTDAERNRDEWIAGITSAMAWVGVDWDEGPFFQSERTHLYSAAVAKLLDAKQAYYCQCVSDEVRERNIANHGQAEAERGYDGFCRDRQLSSGAVRFRSPDEGTTTVVDLIRGEPTFQNSLIEDFIVQRTNGGFMFLLANVVDDIDMRISHVVRAEEHLPNTPKAVLLWSALAPDVPLPVFAHLPVIVNEKRQKLSKRRDKVAVEDYKAQGILPEAMANYLATLGWMPPGAEEIIPLAQMIEQFDLADVNKSSAFFDIKKLLAFNGHYIRALTTDEFVVRCEGFVRDDWRTDDRFKAVVPLIQERLLKLDEVEASVNFFFTTPVIDEEARAKAVDTETGTKILADFSGRCADVDWNREALKSVLEEIGTSHGLKLGKAQAPIRAAVTGRLVGPPLFESLEVLGKDETLKRLGAANLVN